MDYEKKYKNALEWARQVMNGETGFIRKEVEEIFPELKESEDERIRKEIIAIVKSQKEQQCHIDGAVYDKMIAWLEKQGEQKPFDYENCNIQQKDFAPKSAMEAIKEEKVDNANKKETETFCDVEQKVFDNLLNNGEQLWSKEDENSWTNTIIMIKECAANHYTKDSITLVIDWLKSLKQRLNK